MGTIGNDFREHFTGERITFEDLLRQIEENGGAKGLNLSGKDLSGSILSPKALNQYRLDMKIDETPTWQTESGGINLEGADLSWSDFTMADLSESCLRNTDLRGARLENVDFIDADLRGAILWDASFNSATLDGAKLHDANLFGANFTNSTVNKENIGNGIIQELESYTLPSDMEMLPERNRLWQASKIYRKLKSSFDSGGLYDNASWAYRKARVMEKQLARHNMSEAWKNKHWSKVIINFRKYITDSFVELLSDYGENPSRVLLSIILLWLGFAVIYRVLSGVVDSVSSEITHSPIDLLAFSLGTMTTIEAVGLKASNILAMRFLMPIETLFGIALTGLFGYVLGNRINRI